MSACALLPRPAAANGQGAACPGRRPSMFCRENPDLCALPAWFDWSGNGRMPGHYVDGIPIAVANAAAGDYTPGGVGAGAAPLFH